MANLDFKQRLNQIQPNGCAKDCKGKPQIWFNLVESLFFIQNSTKLLRKEQQGVNLDFKQRLNQIQPNCCAKDCKGKPQIWFNLVEPLARRKPIFVFLSKNQPNCCSEDSSGKPESGLIWLNL